MMSPLKTELNQSIILHSPSHQCHHLHQEHSHVTSFSRHTPPPSLESFTRHPIVTTCIIADTISSHSHYHDHYHPHHLFPHVTILSLPSFYHLVFTCIIIFFIIPLHTPYALLPSTYQSSSILTHSPHMAAS